MPEVTCECCGDSFVVFEHEDLVVRPQTLMRSCARLGIRVTDVMFDFVDPAFFAVRAGLAERFTLATGLAPSTRSPARAVLPVGALFVCGCAVCKHLEAARLPFELFDLRARVFEGGFSPREKQLCHGGLSDEQVRALSEFTLVHGHFIVYDAVDDLARRLTSLSRHAAFAVARELRELRPLREQQPLPVREPVPAPGEDEPLHEADAG